MIVKLTEKTSCETVTIVFLCVYIITSHIPMFDTWPLHINITNAQYMTIILSQNLLKKLPLKAREIECKNSTFNGKTSVAFTPVLVPYEWLMALKASISGFDCDCKDFFFTFKNTYMTRDFSEYFQLIECHSFIKD